MKAGNYLDYRRQGAKSLGSCRSSHGWRRLRLGRAVHVLCTRFADIDAALEVGAVLNADALADHVTAERTFVTNISPIAGGHVALDLAQDHDFLGVDVGLDLPVATNGHPVPREVDSAFDAAIDVERFRASHLAFDDQRFANRGLLLAVHNGIARGGRWGRLAGKIGGSAHDRFLRLRWCGRFRVRGGVRRTSGLPHFSLTSFLILQHTASSSPSADT